MPLSATATTSSGMRSASSRAVSNRTFIVRRSRLFTPTIRAPTRSARSSSCASWTSTSASSPTSRVVS
jgi:hypothetical protein